MGLTFSNPNDAVGSVILFRNGYFFGNAYFLIYEANLAFGVNWAQNFDALPDNGAENGTPPLHGATTAAAEPACGAYCM